MKMVILEANGKYAAALMEDGTISRIPNQNYRVGQELIRPVQKQRTRFTVYAKRIAAVAAVFVFLLAGANVYLKTPVSYVSLDVNPSVEYKLNLFNKVVEVIAVNEDAKELLKDTALVNQPADKAIRQTVELLSERNYLTAEEKNDIVIAASAADSKKAKAVMNQVTQATVEATASLGVKADIIVFESSVSDHKQAEKLGTTQGKMMLVNQAVEQDVTTMDPEVDDMEEVNTLLQLPVKELVSTISEANLMQISENSDSIVFIQSELSAPSSEESSESTSVETDIPAAVSDEAATSQPESSSQTTGNESSNHASSDESVSLESSEEESMDVSEIPEVIPGIPASSTEDTSSSSEQENSLSTTTPSDTTSSEELDVSEIPSVTPGIGAGDTSDVDSETEQENALDITTSAEEVFEQQELLPEENFKQDAESTLLEDVVEVESEE